MELSIIIVSYNTCSETLACLKSVFRYPPPCTFEVILLDNASHDSSAEAVAEAFPRVRLIVSAENTGFAGGNNVAAQHAYGRRLLLLNPDTEVRDGSLTALWQFAQKSPNRRIWGGRTVFADGRLNPASCWAQMTVWSQFCLTSGLKMAFPHSALFNPEAFGGWPRDTERAVDIVSGCYLLIDHSLWRKLDGFDPQFFMYAEEADLCLRAARLGAKPAITPTSTIIHHGGASEPSQTDKMIRLNRGRITLMRKHWRPVPLKAGLALYWLWAWLRLIGSHITTGPRDIPGQSRDKWRAIWTRRHEWLAGY